MDYNTPTVLISALPTTPRCPIQMTAEEQQEFRILMQRRQDEEKIRYKHIKERWAEQERWQALRRGRDEY